MSVFWSVSGILGLEGGCQRVDLALGQLVDGKGRDSPNENSGSHDNGPRFLDVLRGLLPYMPQQAAQGRRPVWRQFHDEGCGVAPQDGLLEHESRDKGDDHADRIDEHDDIRRVFREKGAREKDVHGKLRAAAHEGDDEDGNDAVTAAFQRACGHDGRHRTAEAENHREHRLPMKAEGVEELVGREGSARHVAHVLKHGEKEEHDNDKRHEGEHAAHTAYDSVDQEGTQKALWHH